MNTAELSSNDSDGDLMAKPAVKSITTLSDTTLWRRVRDGSFPAPIRISPGRVAWRRSDIKAWVTRRAEAR